MNKRKIPDEVLKGLDDFAAWRAGERKLRMVTVDLPRAADVAKIRQNLGLSQTAFAAFMGVSVGTLRNWEQLRREPQGPARAFLRVASVQPMAVLAAFNRLARRPRLSNPQIDRSHSPLTSKSRKPWPSS